MWHHMAPYTHGVIKGIEGCLICKKLDRVLLNDTWLHSYPQSYCVFESGGCSHHMCCRVHIKAEISKPRRPFKFTNALTSLPGFLPLVKSFWSGTEDIFNSTSALFRLSKKLKALKPKIRELSKENFGDLPNRTKKAYDELCHYQTKTLINPTQEAMEEGGSAYVKWHSCLILRKDAFVKNQNCIG